VSNIKLLDTTLRDGMNVTDFYIDDAAKSPIIKGLEQAGVDIIETGFLRQGEQKANSAEYKTVETINRYIAPKKKGVMYAAICSLFDGAAPDSITGRTPESIDIIRVASFKSGVKGALKLAEEVKSKGYEVMFQISRTTDYTESELKDLLAAINDLELFGVGLVDTLGIMMPKDAARLTDFYNGHLNDDISVCYHFHNNTQLAYANAITALERTPQNRNIILDASIFGMGCGAGNLPLELAMKYLNDNYGKKYRYSNALGLYERFFLKTFQTTHWGYQPRNFLTAEYKVHPYYGVYLEEMYGFTSSMLEKAFGDMSDGEKVNFIRRYADEIGKKYK
jgi:4-hydroxy 2-oxovalerate aldolase